MLLTHCIFDYCPFFRILILFPQYVMAKTAIIQVVIVSNINKSDIYINRHTMCIKYLSI